MFSKGLRFLPCIFDPPKMKRLNDFMKYYIIFCIWYNSALVTASLPSTSSVGDLVWIVGKGVGGWKIAQNAGQKIHFGNQDTTTGAGGHLDSSN